MTADYRQRALVLSRRLRALRRYVATVDSINTYLAQEWLRSTSPVYCGLCGAAAKPGIAKRPEGEGDAEYLVNVCDLCRAVRVDSESLWQRPYP